MHVIYNCCGNRNFSVMHSYYSGQLLSPVYSDPHFFNIYITNTPSTLNDNSTGISIHNSHKNVRIRSSSLDTATTKLDHARGRPDFWFPT